MSKGPRVVAVLLLGVFMGGGAVAALSVRAGRLYGQMLRLSFAGEEERRATDALRKGEVELALVHASALVALGDARAFSADESLWDLGFPFMGAFVGSSLRYPVDDAAASKGLALARLGLIWEKFGDKKTASQYFEKAAQLMGASNPVAARREALASMPELQPAP